MIPLRLALRNFLCYRDGVPPLSFEGMHVACLSGDNGHGKSALLDAITWALWGKARGRADDELVHMGMTEMEVAFDFLMSEAHYRVIRKRSKPPSERSAGHTVLEFQAMGEDGFRPLSGNTIQETQRRIDNLLRIDYQTFINSAFILQGRADEFTLKPPSKRKEILADMLGLALYDRLEERARALHKEKELIGRELAKSIEDIEQELGKREVYQREWQEAQRDLEGLNGQIKLQEDTLLAAKENKRALGIKKEQMKEVEQRLSQGQRELGELRKQLAAHEKNIQQYQQALGERTLIERGYQELLDIRHRNEGLNAKLGKLLSWREELSRLEKVIAEGKNVLITQEQVLQSIIQTLEPRARSVSSAKNELEEAQRAAEAIERLEKNRVEKQSRAQEKASQLQDLKTRNAQLRQEGTLLKEKLNMLAEGEARCPLCETELGEEERNRIHQKYEGEINQKREDYRSNEAALEALQRELEVLNKEHSELERRIKKEKEATDRRIATLQQRIAEALQAEGEIQRAQEELGPIQDRLEKGDFVLAEQARRKEVSLEIERTGYNSDEHDGVRQKLRELDTYEERHKRIEQAETSLFQERELQAKVVRDMSLWESMINDEIRKKKELDEEVAQLPALEVTIREGEKALDSLYARRSEAQHRVGAASQKLAHCDFLEKQREDKARDLRQALEEKAIYEELAVAFGKKGVQAMIIEAALPEIEEETNAILARMTDNRMHVAIETQRDTKKGETVETLDIKIADELGTRSYEMFSGGEAFRINFALRIALSKMLARRAGARLQTLVIDEGFGTQDSSGREKLVEAINSIQEDFERILVITHIQDIKELFPVRIEVTKTSEGSTYSVIS